jgi:glucose/mannose-6-phosphate isomerase
MAGAEDMLNKAKAAGKGFFGKMMDRFKGDEETGIRKDITEAAFHIQNAIKITGEFRVLEKIDKILIYGISTNALAGDLLKSYLSDSDYEIFVLRTSVLPEFADEKTLCFFVSYSGEDVEPIEAFRKANKKGCRIMGLTSGGRLEKVLNTAEKEHIPLPKGLNETYMLPYLFFPMLQVLENSRKIDPQKKHIEETVSALRKPIYEEKSEELAESLKDKIPIIYSSPKLSTVAQRWKHMFNIISRVHAFHSTFSEAAFNDINGFTTHLGDFHVVFLIDDTDEKYIIKEMRTVKDILKSKNISVTEILIKGSNEMTKFFSGIHIGDWTAFELSKTYSLGTGEKDIITEFRRKMSDNS